MYRDRDSWVEKGSEWIWWAPEPSYLKVWEENQQGYGCLTQARARSWHFSKVCDRASEKATREAANQTWSDRPEILREHD